MDANNFKRENYLDHIFLVQYRITFQPEDVIIMPPSNKGNIIRGAFGRTLRGICCVNYRSGSCKRCEEGSRCPYHLIFDPVEIVEQKRMRNVPRGYVIKPPLDTATAYTKDRPFVFDMILIGNIIKHLPWVIVPFNQLGTIGIGRNKGRFTIGDIYLVTGSSIKKAYDPETRIFTNHEDYITGQTIMDQAKNLDPFCITIEFLTPARIKYNPTGKKAGSIIVREPQFHHIIRRLIARSSILSLAYLNKPMDMDFKGMIARSMDIKRKDMDIIWVEEKRYSRTETDRKGRHAIHDQSGFKGKITFEGDLIEFLPLIVLGEYIHVGEDTVFGNGWYRVV